MASKVETLMCRLGFPPREKDPAILFAGRGRAGFEAAAAVIDRLSGAGQRLVVSLACADPDVRHWLANRFAGARIGPLPFDAPGLAALWLSAGKVRTVVALPDANPFGRHFAATIARRATPLVQFGGAPDAGTIPAPEWVVGDDAQSDPGYVAEKLLPLVGRERDWDVRSDQPLSRMFGRLLANAMNSTAGRTALQPVIERFDTPEALKARLGTPNTLLCLGNGPSSEGPDIVNVAYDALFRVNHSWQERGILTTPDVVFTGERATMRRITDAILGVRTASTEKTLLMTRGLRPFKGKLRYFNAEALWGSKIDSRADGQRPTNGAIMIAVAVALQPARLVIAGIDLFRHPEGSYPGGSAVPNAYTPAHSADADLEMIFAALMPYEGELVILSEVMQAEWDAHRKRLSP